MAPPLTLATYSNNLKKLWEEMKCLEPKPRCTCSGCKCDIYKKQDEIEYANHVMQFLMGLNDSYNVMVSNILLLDPLPTFNKTYSIISRVERRKFDVVTGLNSTEVSALAVKTTEQQRNNTNIRNGNRKKDFGKKEEIVCSHCNKIGLLEEACFKKHVYPDWFKEIKKPKKCQVYANNVNLTEVPNTNVIL